MTRSIRSGASSSYDLGMALHNRRRRLAEIVEREAAGESFWTEDFAERPRTRVEQYFRSLTEYWWVCAEHARELILHDEGLRFLSRASANSASDFLAYLAGCNDDMMPTVLEAIHEGFASDSVRRQINQSLAADFATGVNAILLEERISWEFVNGQMAPFSSRELHVEVVAPTLQLLATGGWERVEAAYQAALVELSSGNAPDAITDAGTALQEALELLGAEGNALGPLIASAKRKGLFLGHDKLMVDSLVSAATWVSADRSQVGDAHKVSSAGIEDAWMTVHIVGAVILRLSASRKRPS